MRHHSLPITKTDHRGRRLFVITLLLCRVATILSASQLKEMLLQVLNCCLNNQFIVCHFLVKMTNIQISASKLEGYVALFYLYHRYGVPGL